MFFIFKVYLLERAILIKSHDFSQVEELKLQLRMCEDARDGVRRDLIEAQRKVRETEEQRDGQRKENLELKRGINAEVHEKKTVVKANEELREQVKRAEQERIVLKVRV